MNAIDNIFSDIVGSLSTFVLQTLLPWAWEHKMWLAALIPFAVVIAIAKWIRG
jgi:hypothetical protein